MQSIQPVSRRIAIVANGIAGDGKARTRTLAARSELWGRELEFYNPRSLHELKSTVMSLSSVTHDGLVVIGGDGTVNHVIRCLNEHPSPVPLYPFPGGTANDLARELGLRADWFQVQQLMDNQSIDWIDLVEVNGVPFATVAGMGICSVLTRQFNEKRADSRMFRSLSRLMRFQMYTVLGTRLVLFGRNYVHRVSIQSSEFNEILKTPAVFFCNQTYLAGDVKVAPPIDNTDRRFNVLIADSCSRAQMIKAILELKNGRLPERFFVFSTDHLVIRDLDERKIAAFGDGEALAESSRLDVRIAARKLPVYRGRAGKAQHTQTYSRQSYAPEMAKELVQ